MIAFKEILGHTAINDISIKEQQNIDDLLKRINIIRDAWAQPMIVTSGYRTLQDHLRIYAAKGITDRSKIPMQSKHLTGNAVDIADPHGELYLWLHLQPGIAALDTANMWCEMRTTGWAHFQRLPYGSYTAGGSRWFLP